MRRRLSEMSHVDWKARALAAEARVAELESEVQELRENAARLGRKPNKPTTADQRLVVAACKALTLTRVGLAEELGIGRNNSAMLSRPLSASLAERIRALISQVKKDID